MPKEKQKESLYTRVQSLGETANYFLMTGVLPQGVGEYDGVHYLLVNKDTDVIEVETRILAKAHEYLSQLQGALDERFGREELVEEKLGKVVPITQYDH